MEENYVRAQLRERTLKNIAKRRENWAKRKWKISQKGNSYLKFNITAYENKKSSWKTCIFHEGTKAKTFSQIFSSENDAKLGAFELLMKHQEKKH